MATLIKEVRLICVEQTATDNHNKYWVGQLFDDDSWTARWGRVGYESDENSGTWSDASKFESKVRSKLKGRPGKAPYVEQKTVGEATTNSGSTVKVDINLREIAKRELVKDTSDKVLTGLVDRLVKANIHKITATTNITFNNVTGLFTTPMGIVTPEGISEARDILGEIQPAVKAGRFTNTLNNAVVRYLRIIPQNMGMKRFNAETVFPDEASLQKQSDILDSLAASYQAMTTNPQTPNAKPTETGVFKVDLELANSQDASRLTKWFESTKKRMHNYDDVHVKTVYQIKIHDMDKSFLRTDPAVKEVFHGTSEANCLSILKSGLRVSPPSTAYSIGKMFGNGIYGALASTKSLGYTYGRWTNAVPVGSAGWLYICDFAMGKTYKTTADGHRFGDRAPSAYDSYWAQASASGLKNDELIVYENKRVNIKFLLECVR